jgi:adenine-specific DNA-methyltransferase
LEYTLDDGLGLYKKGATLMRTGEAGAREKRPKGYYPIYVSSDLNRMSLKKEKTNDYEIYPQTKNGKQMSWRRSPETLMQSFNEFIITKSGDNISFNKKQRLAEDLINGKKPKTLFYKPEYSSGN